MLNFNYDIPTKVFFGKDQISVLGEQVKKYGSKVLLVYGGGSIKKSGLYDRVVEILNNANIQFLELSGVEPNPRITSVRKGAELCKENNIDFILAVGAGSVIDCAKVIAAANYYDEDPWNFLTRKAPVQKVLPIGTILTLAATGSEMDPFAVISNLDTNEKLSTAHPDMSPKFSILDPTYTFTVPASQTAAGSADIMSHIYENYFSNTKSAYLQSRMAEAMLKTCIKYGPIAYKEPENYEARANLMWTSSLAINGLISYGKETEWSVHAMEHELSAFYDITHGVGLALLTPHWMKYILNDDTVDGFVEYGVNVWGLDPEGDKFELANKAIDKTKEFFVSLGLPTKLQEIGIDRENLETMAKGAVRYGEIGNFRKLNAEDVLKIFESALSSDS